MPRYKAGEGTNGDCFCDGEPLNDVVEIDTDEGYAVVIDRDQNGNIQLDGEHVRYRHVTGKMEFVPKP